MEDGDHGDRGGSWALGAAILRWAGAAGPRAPPTTVALSLKTKRSPRERILAANLGMHGRDPIENPRIAFRGGF